MTGRREAITANLLATLKDLNPPLEKLMADRVNAREQLRSAQADLEETEVRLATLREIREVEIPRYIGIAKVITLMAASFALIALALALFNGLFEVKLTATLFASLLLPIWLVDQAEAKFGRWVLQRNGRADYIACQRGEMA